MAGYSGTVKSKNGGIAVSFASEVKEEICKADIEQVCCARAELAGLICFGAAVRKNEIRLRTENIAVAQRFCDLIDFLYKIKIGVASLNSGIHSVSFEGADVLKVLRDTRLAGVPIHIDREIIRGECCKAALLRGIFLGGGSMIDPGKSYHAEMVSNHFSLEKDLRPVFEYFELYPKMINRSGNFVFYIKESSQIENLLAAVGAHSKLMDFLNVVIERDLKNSTNRRVNFEIANDTKIFKTAMRQQDAIKKIVLENGWQSLSPELAAVAKLRMKNVHMPLSEIAREIGISKSGVNHRMKKIMQLAEMDG